MTFKKIYLTVATTLAVLGLLVLTVGLFFGGRHYLANADLNDLQGQNKTSDGKKITVEKEALPAFQKLEVTLDMAKFVLQPSDDQHAYLSYTIANQEYPNDLQYQQTADTFVITKEHTQKNSWVDLSFINFFFSDDDNRMSDQTTVTLYLPEQTLDAAMIKVEAGTIALTGLHAKEAELSAGPGTVTLHDAVIDQLRVENAAGTTALKQSQIEQADLTSDTGRILLEQTTIKQSAIRNDVGSIELKQATLNNSTIQTDSGKISSDALTLTGTNQLTTAIGDVALSLTKETLANTSFSLKNDTGSITPPPVAGKKSAHAFESSAAKENSLTVTVDVGNIQVE